MVQALKISANETNSLAFSVMRVEFIKKNIALININAEIYQACIGNKKGTQTIHYNETDPGFGFLCEGAKSMKVNYSPLPGRASTFKFC